MIAQTKADYLQLVEMCDKDRLDTTHPKTVVANGDVFYTITFKRDVAFTSQLFAKRLNDLLDTIELLHCGHVKRNDFKVSGHTVSLCDKFGAKKNTNIQNHA